MQQQQSWFIQSYKWLIWHLRHAPCRLRLWPHKWRLHVCYASPPDWCGPGNYIVNSRRCMRCYHDEFIPKFVDPARRSLCWFGLRQHDWEEGFFFAKTDEVCGSGGWNINYKLCRRCTRRENNKELYVTHKTPRLIAAFLRAIGSS